MHNFGIKAENAVSANWRLRLVDGIDDFEDDKRAKIIRSVIKDEQIKEVLIERNPSVGLGTKSSLEEQRKKPDATKNVVIVEDDPECLHFYKSILLDEGYAVHGFTDPYTGLEMAFDFYNSNEKIDLSIIEIKMPGLNGLQVFRVLKSLDKDMKILFVSDLYHAEELLKVYPGNETTVLKKPVKTENLVNKVKESLVHN